MEEEEDNGEDKKANDEDEDKDNKDKEEEEKWDPKLLVPYDIISHHIIIMISILHMIQYT